MERTTGSVVISEVDVLTYVVESKAKKKTLALWESVGTAGYKTL